MGMFEEHAMNTACQLGAYKAIAEMMKTNIRRMEAAEKDSLEAEFAMMNLISLAKQFEETVERFEAEDQII